MNATMNTWNDYTLNEPTSFTDILLSLHQTWEYDEESIFNYRLCTTYKCYNVSLNQTYIDVADGDTGIILYRGRFIGDCTPKGLLRLYEDANFYDNVLLSANTRIWIESEDN